MNSNCTDFCLAQMFCSAVVRKCINLFLPRFSHNDSNPVSFKHSERVRKKKWGELERKWGRDCHSDDRQEWKWKLLSRARGLCQEGLRWLWIMALVENGHVSSKWLGHRRLPVSKAWSDPCLLETPQKGVMLGHVFWSGFFVPFSWKKKRMRWIYSCSWSWSASGVCLGTMIVSVHAQIEWDINRPNIVMGRKNYQKVTTQLCTYARVLWILNLSILASWIPIKNNFNTDLVFPIEGSQASYMCLLLN